MEEERKMAYYFTGDMHGNLWQFNQFLDLELTSEDILFVCGDFGFIWSGSDKEKDKLDWIEKRCPFQIAFVDGNHENFSLLKLYPETIWHNGKVHKIRNNIFHLMRGEIFNLNGKTLFALGGANSIDKENRREFISWWPDEDLSYSEIENACSNLNLVNWKVDYIITHDLPQEVLDNSNLHLAFYDSNSVRRTLNYFNKNISFEKWFAGHHHIDKKINEKYQILYLNFIKIK